MEIFYNLNSYFFKYSIKRKAVFVSHISSSPTINFLMSGDSIFAGVKKLPPVEVFALNKACLEEKSLNKVNLTVGAFRTSEGKPWVLPVVRKTEISIAQDELINHEYLPGCGLETFTKAATTLMLGEKSPVLAENKAFGVQSISGTGALHIGAAFLHRVLNYKVFMSSDPTWENHNKVFEASGFDKGLTYRYWDPKTHGINFDGLIEDFENAPDKSVIILHTCAHNPTGCDPTQEQWKKMAEVIKKKKHFPFFDTAYQGFASGNPDKDAWPVRYFAENGFELFSAQSFAKNFGLYSERAGNLTVVQKSSETTAFIQSQFTVLIRVLYSNPPAFGSRIVSKILNDEVLRSEWMDCIKIMSSRIIHMRECLFDHLNKLNTPGNWNHILEQIGMFSYTGLTEKQVKYLIEEHHVYLLTSGRINMCGLNEDNAPYVAKAIYDAVTKINED